MKKQKIFKSLLVLLLTVFVSFSLLTSIIHADDEANTYTTDSGISITLPKEYDKYALWNQATSDASGIKENGFPNLSVMLNTIKDDGFELYTYRDDIDENSSYRVYIAQYDAPENLSNDNLLSTFFNRIESSYQTTYDSPTLGYGTVEINDLTLFKIYFETPGGNPDKVFAYMLPTNDGLIHELFFWNHCKTNDPYHLDSLTYNAMSTIAFSKELTNKADMLIDNSFTMVNGYHHALFEFEDMGRDNKSSTIDTTLPINRTPYQKFISFEFPTWIILILLITILLFGVKVSKKNEWQENPLSIENSKNIQGFFALAIIIHHLAQDLTPNVGVLNAFSEFGVLFVGIFFFFSGYGLYTSLKTKKNYLKGFLLKRLTSVLIPFYVCILIFMLCACIKGDSFNLESFIVTITGWILINSHMWFIVEIAILYIAFFVIYSFIKNRKNATIVMSTFVVFLTIGSLLLGHGKDLSSKYWFMGEWWYNTTLTFILGIVVSQNSNKVKELSQKCYKILLPLFTILTIAFYFLTKYALSTYSYWNEYPGYPGYKEKFICLIIQLSWVILFVITVLLIMMKVKFNNKILKFLGSISLELYLIHNLFLTGLHDGSMMTIKSNSLYILLTILFSIGLATLISGFDKYAVGLINGKYIIQEEEDKSSNRIHSIDTLRIVMAFLVVTIHIPFNGTVGNVFITYGKVAVPFFLVVCGYFLYRKDSEKMMPRLKKQAIRMFVFYVLSNIVYWLANIIIASIDKTTFYITKKQIIDFILYNMSPFSEHLWFFGSLLYALIILMILNKLKIVDYAMFASPILIGVYVSLSYLNIAEAYVLRNAILVGLPYTMMGMLIHRYKDKLMKIKTPLLWIMTFVLCTTAIIELNTYKQGVNVPFISIEILVYIVVILCLKYPNFGKNTLFEKMSIKLSLPIYVLHILVIMFIGYIIPTNVGLISNYGAITVFVLTAFISTIYVIIKQLLLNKKYKKIEN